MSQSTKLNVGLLIIATGKYDQFVAPLMASVREHFLTDHDVNIHLFTDKIHNNLRIYQHQQEHLGFPAITLRRYHIFSRKREVLEQYDYLFYVDVDSRFVAPVGTEIIPTAPHELTAILHPGFWDGGGSWETKTMSTAFVPALERQHYWCGGIQGGTSKAYLDAAETMASNIDIDSKWNYTAVWNDESHWNKYLTTHKPHTLLPAYCYPEEKPDWFTWCGEPKILALCKNHEEVRS